VIWQTLSVLTERGGAALQPFPPTPPSPTDWGAALQWLAIAMLTAGGLALQAWQNKRAKQVEKKADDVAVAADDKVNKVADDVSAMEAIVRGAASLAGAVNQQVQAQAAEFQVLREQLDMAKEALNSANNRVIDNRTVITLQGKKLLRMEGQMGTLRSDYETLKAQYAKLKSDLSATWDAWEAAIEPEDGEIKQRIRARVGRQRPKNGNGNGDGH